jgi:hypothetical protein
VKDLRPDPVSTVSLEPNATTSTPTSVWIVVDTATGPSGASEDSQVTDPVTPSAGRPRTVRA